MFTATGREIVITQDDVRNIQLAKGAQVAHRLGQAARPVGVPARQRAVEGEPGRQQGVKPAQQQTQDHLNALRERRAVIVGPAGATSITLTGSAAGAAVSGPSPPWNVVDQPAVACAARLHAEALGGSSKDRLAVASICFRFALRRRIETIGDQVQEHPRNVLWEDVDFTGGRARWTS